MKNKYTLKGERIFIENDLSGEERKIQEKMNRGKETKRQGKGGKSRIRKSEIGKIAEGIDRNRKRRSKKK